MRKRCGRSTRSSPAGTREWNETSELGPSLSGDEPGKGKSFEDTVRDYLRHELMNQPQDVSDAVLQRAEELMRETQA